MAGCGSVGEQVGHQRQNDSCAFFILFLFVLFFIFLASPNFIPRDRITTGRATTINASRANRDRRGYLKKKGEKRKKAREMLRPKPVYFRALHRGCACRLSPNSYVLFLV